MPGRKNSHVAAAGKRFQELRGANDYELKDVERETLGRFGEEFVVLVSQLSRIENGQHGRVSLDDSMTLGALFGLSPVEVCRLYGVPVASQFLEAEKERPQALVQAEAVLKELSPEVARHFLEGVRVEIVKAKQLQHEFVPRRRKTEPPAATREPALP